MGVGTALREHLLEWAGGDTLKQAVTDTIMNLARAEVEMARIIAMGPLAAVVASKRGDHTKGGDFQKELDAVTNKIVTDALKASPVAWIGSDEDEEPIALNAGAPLAVNFDPLEGSSNIDTNVSIGTIFSILPAEGSSPLLQPGRNQLAAGFIIYGPQTALVLSLGQGTGKFWLDPETGEFLLGERSVKIPAGTREYAINSSNFRHWDDAVKAYVIDCKLGADGPRKADYDMRWSGALIVEAFRF